MSCGSGQRPAFRELGFIRLSEIVNMDRLPVDDRPAHDRAAGERERPAQDAGDRSVMGCDPTRLAFHEHEHRIESRTYSGRVLGDGIQHGLKVSR